MKNVRKLMLFAVLAVMAFSCSAESASTKEQLANAKDEGKTVLVVVSDSNTSSDNLKSLAQSTATDLGNVSVIEMNRDDEANSELVAEYRLSGAPMPLLLVFSDKGLLMGGMIEEQATAEAIENAIPTPKSSEISYAISQGQPVIAVVSNSEFKSNKSALELCQQTVSEIDAGAAIVLVDTADANEARLIKQFSIADGISDTHIVTINTQGMLTGSFDSLPTKEELLSAATHVQQTGCSSGCGPSCK